MFEPILRFLLIAGSLFTTFFILRRIRSAKVLIKDSIFWILFSFTLLIISACPQIAVWAADKLKFDAAINFVFLLIIFLLLIKLFSASLRISQLDATVQNLVQRLALNEKKQEEDKEVG